MKLDRNLNQDGTGKYALILLRKFNVIRRVRDYHLDSVMVPTEAIDAGDKPDSEFFVIRLKDKYATAALQAYADAAVNDDPEWANEIYELAKRASVHKNKQQPT